MTCSGQHLQSQVVRVELLCVVTMTTPCSPADDAEVRLQGCYQDDSSSRDLPVRTILLGATQELCVQYCVNLNHKYAGLQVRGPGRGDLGGSSPPLPALKIKFTSSTVIQSSMNLAEKPYCARSTSRISLVPWQIEKRTSKQHLRIPFLQ